MVLVVWIFDGFEFEWMCWGKFLIEVVFYFILELIDVVVVDCVFEMGVFVISVIVEIVLYYDYG